VEASAWKRTVLGLISYEFELTAAAAAAMQGSARTPPNYLLLTSLLTSALSCAVCCLPHYQTARSQSSDR
jgi:hypothetical protein